MTVTLDLLSELIRIPSVNPMGRPYSGPNFLESAIVDFLERWLRGKGLPTRRQFVSPGRENLLATYTAPNPKRHVLLEVHTDTVPADDMIVPPFEATLRDGRVYGRGACDNKGPMTAMLIALNRLHREKPSESCSVTLALVADEEYSFTGAAELVKHDFNYSCAIVAEPTDLHLVTAHKGAVRWIIRSEGVACHSSTPKLGENAVYRMANILSAIETYSDRLSNEFQHPRLGPATISVGIIEGGIAVNIVPPTCSIEIDRRLLPGEDPVQAMNHLETYLRANLDPKTRFHFDPPFVRIEPLSDEGNRDVTKTLGRHIDAIRGSHEDHAVAYGTDAWLYAKHGVPSVVFGPGSIKKAHTKDEFIPLAEIESAAEILFQFCAHGGA